MSQSKPYRIKQYFDMKKFVIFFCLFFAFAESVYANDCSVPPKLECSGSNFTGHCILAGEGYLFLDSSINIDTLTVISNTPSCPFRLTTAQGSNNRIGKIIIQAKAGKDIAGTETGFALNLHYRGYSTLTVGDIVLGVGVDETNARKVRFHNSSIKLENTSLSRDKTGAYIPRKETSSSAGNTGGEFTPPENATPEQLLQSVMKYAQALNEQLHLESTNALILYNILNNYDGTYISYDYGMGHQVGIGALNNGGFARYYHYNSNNGVDIGAKLKIPIANRLYLRGVAYYTYFGSSSLASHSLVFGLGVLKNFDFGLGSSGNVFWVLNPSANLYYAATLKGEYMPANHLGFGNVALDTGVRIKNTSLLLRGSVGGVLNSLQSISIDLGNGATYKNSTFFNNALYSASFVFSQRFPLQRHNGRIYLNADIGGVFVDKVLDSIANKSYVLKAGMLMGYEYGGDVARESGTRATRQSSRYQKLKNKNVRKTLTTHQAPNKRAISLTPATTPATIATTPAKDSKEATNNSQKPEPTKAEKKAQQKAQKKEEKAQNKATKSAQSKSTSKATLPKINLPKVPKSNAKQPTKQNAKPTNAKSNTTKSNTKSNSKPNTKSSVAKSTKPTNPTKSTKPTKQTPAKSNKSAKK